MNLIINLVLLWLTNLFVPKNSYSEKDEMEDGAAFFFGTAFTLENQEREQQSKNQEPFISGEDYPVNDDYDHIDW